MATTDHSAKLHSELCTKLMARFSAQMKGATARELIEYMIDKGVIDCSRLYEIVTSLETGIPLDSVCGRDLADNSDCKLSAAFGPVNGQKTAFGWRIKVANSAGDIRAILHNPKDSRTYEANIPHREHSSQKYITITDCKKGARFGRWTRYVRSIA